MQSKCIRRWIVSSLWPAGLMLFVLSAAAADFAGGGVGAIPDNNAAGLNVTFNVSGIAQPIQRIRLRMTLSHTWTGDLQATLTSPGGLAHLLIVGRTGVTRTSSVGASANLGGDYVFDDTGDDFWATAAATSSSSAIPSRAYRTSTGGVAGTNHGGCGTSLTAAFGGLSGANANGTWTLNIADRSPSDTGSISAALLSVITDEVFTDAFDAVHGSCKLAQFDFTGSGRTSYVIVRNTGGGANGALTWFVQDNDGTTTGAQQNFQLGNVGDVFVPGDFDGDGIADAAVWTTGAAGAAHYTVLRSSRPNDAPLLVTFGQTGDDPTQVGDYDGDGRDDFAIYRSGATAGSASSTLIRFSRNLPDRTLVTGENGAFAAGGVDYDGDGVADMAIQANAGSNVASFRIYDGRSGAIVNSFTFGTPTDVVVIGNHSGNALYDITTVRGSAGSLVWNTYDVGAATAQPAVTLGQSATDFVLSGDFDGDGLDDYAVWRPSATPGASAFQIRPSGNPGTPLTVNMGQNGDYPVANARRH